LVNRTADFVFGYYRKRSITTELYTNTVPHFQSSVIGAIYLRPHVFNTFEVLAYPFHLQTWGVIILCVALILTVTRLIRLQHPKSMRTFSMLTTTFGLPIRENIEYRHSYLMLGPWIWGTFLLRSIYSGLLYYLFSNDIYNKLPLSLQDATNQHYISIMNHYTYFDVENIPFYRQRYRHNLQPIILNSSDEMIAIKYMEEHLNRKTYAVVSKEFLMYYTQENDKIEMFYTIPETVMKQQLSIYFAKHTYLARQFDITIRDMRSSGLLGYYMKRYFDTRTSKNSQQVKDKMIKQNDLLGIYLICGVLNMVAIFTFILEVLSRKVKKLRMLFD
ncbi:uncharacterized protein LOC133335966, partial [Musca vetustissima]|uniref:uncharacterized protein LOC133335966 n=1 Tax=Musca vetustissima TaxID=27455 RepID=UPI002AB62BEE